VQCPDQRCGEKLGFLSIKKIVTPTSLTVSKPKKFRPESLLLRDIGPTTETF
jgi:hypothetical protein